MAATLPVLVLALGGPTRAQHSATTLMSRADSGQKGDSTSQLPSLSGDGRFVAFGSDADNLSRRHQRAKDIFVRDRRRGRSRVSVDSAGRQADQATSTPRSPPTDAASSSRARHQW
jgi:hypothetical protein